MQLCDILVEERGVATISNFIGPANAWERYLRNVLAVEEVITFVPSDVQ